MSHWSYFGYFKVFSICFAVVPWKNFLSEVDAQLLSSASIGLQFKFLYDFLIKLFLVIYLYMTKYKTCVFLNVVIEYSWLIEISSLEILEKIGGSEIFEALTSKAFFPILYSVNLRGANFDMWIEAISGMVMILSCDFKFCRSEILICPKTQTIDTFLGLVCKELSTNPFQPLNPFLIVWKKLKSSLLFFRWVEPTPEEVHGYLPPLSNVHREDIMLLSLSIDHTAGTQNPLKNVLFFNDWNEEIAEHLNPRHMSGFHYECYKVSRIPPNLV